MRKFYTVFLILCIALTSTHLSLAQNNFFSDISERSIVTGSAKRVITPIKFRAISLNQTSLKSFLWALPNGKSPDFNRNNAAIISLPKPDGTTARFQVWESSIQEPALQARFTEIRTFAGQGIDDPYATIRFDLTPRGFHAQILSINGSYYIDPYAVGITDSYVSYYRQDLRKSADWTCDVADIPSVTGGGNGPSNFVTAACRGNELRTYRLAVANTGEYAQAPGINAGTNPVILHAAIVTSVNRVVGVYEKEVAISMVLIANNGVIEYLDAATDPFSGNNNANVLINESQAVIDANIGFDNYDIGHTFSTGGGGLAQLNSPCGNGKARGITGSSSPTGDAYDIDYVAHEIGHQFGGNHSMNGCGSSPNSTKYEPGSGTTIQAYAGICGAQDIQPNSDPFFHGISFDEISNFVMTGNGATCGVATPTNNGIPVVGALPANVSIPVSTPFTLTGTATDPNGDALTYCWEQWDLGNPGAGWNIGLTAAPGNTAPLFKSRAPKTTGSRTFPDIAVIIAGYPSNPPATMGGLKGEVLSPVPRPMKFRLTVRDNRAGGGGVASAGGGGCQASVPVTINVVGSSPFVVLAPNGGESFAALTSQPVTWDVAGTNAAPINTANVKISLSTNGGLTYPTVLIASTPNDGTEALVFPNSPSTTARIKVEAIDNIFFDISDANFTITAATSGFTFNPSTPATTGCGGSTSATVALGTTSAGGFVLPVTLSATSGVPAGTTVSFSTNPVVPGNSTNVTLNNINTLSPGTYNVTITGVAGTITQTTTVSYIVTPGTAPVITSQPTSQSICVGANATFTVAATGATSFQWQVSTNGGSTFTNIPNAIAASYTLNNATAAQNGNQYHVVVSALCGSVTSANAILTVLSGPAITTQPLNVTTCAGQNATFTVTATGGGLSYQWQVSTDGGTNYSDISGANSASLTLNSVTNAMDNNRYRVVVSGTCPSPVTSNGALLSVGNSAAITSQPTNIAVCVGSDASFSVVTTGTVTYQWQVSTNGGTSFTNIPGATNATLTLNAVTASMTGNQYHVLVFNCTGTSIVSNNATLTVNTLIAISQQPVNTTLCAGTNATFSVTAAGSAVTYQWQSASSCTGTFTNIQGATSSTLTLNAVSAAMTGTAYQVVVTSPCGSVTSTCATLTVNTPVVITTQPVNTSVCLPATNVAFMVAATGTGLNYQWQVSTNNGTSFVNIPGATGATLNLVPAAALNGTQYRVVLSGTCTPTLVSNAATLTVNSPVSILTQPVGTETCSGTPATLTVGATSSSPQLITYQWQVSMNGGAFINIPGATSSSLTLDGSTANDGNVYHVIVSGPPCGTVTSNDVVFSVNPTPGITLAAAPHTSLTPYNPTTLFTTVSPGGGLYSYAWYFNNVLLPNVSTSSLPVNTDGVGAYEVQVTDVNTGCVARSNSVTITDSASASNVLFIYPNPSNGQFQVRYYSARTAPTTHLLTVYDSKGARVYQKLNNVSRVYDRMDVNLLNATSGLYRVVLSDASGKRLATGTILIQ